MRRSVMASMLPRPHSTSRLLGAVLAGLALAMASAPAAAQPGKAELAASYDIHFAGIRLGAISVTSKLKDGEYALSGSGRLQFLGGLVWELKGGSSSSGVLTRTGPRPANFAFRFRTSKRKAGKLAMTFARGAVDDVVTDLPQSAEDHPRYVPVAEEHLNGVLDPFSALFMTAASGTSDPDPSICDRRLPVFDGKHRFDLQLSHKRSVRVNNEGKGGYEGPATVCQVQYKPISGYKRNTRGPKFMERTNGIEAWLIPVPEAEMHMPYHVTAPTPYGPATATLTRFQIKLESRKKIVLIN